ncbi:MAG TPA: phage major capsid protein [Gemmatimonadaceae bacterium]
MGATVIDKQNLQKEALELRDQVRTKSQEWREGKITDADYSDFMDRADENNARISKQTKNLERALQYTRGGDGPTVDGMHVEFDADEMPMALRGKSARIEEALKAYQSTVVAARNRVQQAHSFDIGWKAVERGQALESLPPVLTDRDVELITKAQGATGMMGVAASGTTAPAALANGAYFLTGSAGVAVEPEFLPGIVEMRFYPNVIASLFPSMPVSSPVISYVRESAWTNNAAATNEGSTKPTSSNAVTRLTEEIGKITHLAHVTDEMIQDAPYFWSLVQKRLSQGVIRKEEIEVLAGAGVPGVNGILNRSTGFTQHTTGLTAVTNLSIPTSGTPGAGATPDVVASVTPGYQIHGTGTTGTAPTGVEIAEGLLSMLTDIRVQRFFEPDAMVLNPADYMTVRLAKDESGQYLGGSFFGYAYGSAVDAQQSGAVEEGLRLWGKRTLTTPIMPVGLNLVGCFGEAGQILRRSGLQVQATNTNGTDFEQNLWTVRAEERVGLLIERPELFELGQLVNAA